MSCFLPYQSLEVHPHFTANFAVHWYHETTVGYHGEILSSFARDFSSTAQYFLCTSESFVQRSTQTVFIVTLKLPSSIISDSPLAFRWNLPSLAPSRHKFNGNVFTALVSRFIFSHSNRFGLLMAPRSKLPNENELSEVSHVCSQPSCHPTELQSFQSS